MRSRRMISASITTSLKVNSISVSARLLYTWMITRADDYGKMEGEPLHVKAAVFPMTDFVGKDIAEFLEEMSDAGLIVWYSINGKRFIKINDWDNHQTFHGITRTASKIPNPNLGKMVEQSTKVGGVANQKRPHKINQTKLNQTKLNQVGGPPLAASPVKGFLKQFGDLWAQGPGQGKVYPCQFGKDGKIVKDLIGLYGDKNLSALAVKFFESDDPFVQKSGYTIGTFKSQIPKLICADKPAPLQASYHRPLPKPPENGVPMPKEIRDMAKTLAERKKI